jgi:GT2 family glycosyltransferase
MCPRICFDELGLFDEEFDIKYYEDLDFINRILEVNKKIKMTETALIYHAVGSTSRYTKGGESNKEKYDRKWGDKPQFDILAKQPKKEKSIIHFNVDGSKQ